MKKKKVLQVGLGMITIIGLLLVINFIPTWNLQTKDMSRIEGKWITVYYETEEAAAKDVLSYADPLVEEIAIALGFSEKQDVNVYIYDTQQTMQTKKYGFIAPLLQLDWYIGDNRGTEVILTSPANPGSVHSYDDNKEAVLHEIVHAYVSVINPNISLWLTEGMALYLSNGKPFQAEYLEYMEIPSYEDTCTINPIRFSNCGGYTFAHTYIAYLHNTYGWDSVLELLETEDYEKIFHKSQKEIYGEWLQYLSSHFIFTGNLLNIYSLYLHQNGVPVIWVRGRI